MSVTEFFYDNGDIFLWHTFKLRENLTFSLLPFLYTLKLNTNLHRNTKTEYSQPLGFSGVIWRAKHTPDLP